MKLLFDQVRLAQPLADNSAESMPSAAARNLRSGGSINKFRFNSASGTIRIGPE
jgi:hypothetical protein